MQDRAKLILEFWDRSNLLNSDNKEYKNFVKKFLNILLKNDIKKFDATTNSLIKKSKYISAYIVAKENGILAGLEEFSFLNKDLKLKLLKKDGDKIKNNDIIVKTTGNARKILSRERTILNLLQRMSGIATLTNSLDKKLKNNIKLASTRKTQWGLLDKKAVSIGGGLTHRLNLNEGFLIKDNHLKILNSDMETALKTVQNKSKYIEIEVENEKQALIAAKIIKKIRKKNNNLFAIMLDKIKPQEIKSILQELKNKNLYENILFEASGNINEENIEEYADCGADVISMGCITNSAKVLNLSLEIE